MQFVLRFSTFNFLLVQAPDYSTRMAILQTKAENDDISLPNDVTEYIADNVQSNIRELEGALNKVVSCELCSHPPKC